MIRSIKKKNRNQCLDINEEIFFENIGQLHIICGPMFLGKKKTSRLCHELGTYADVVNAQEPIFGLLGVLYIYHSYYDRY